MKETIVLVVALITICIASGFVGWGLDAQDMKTVHHTTIRQPIVQVNDNYTGNMKVSVDVSLSGSSPYELVGALVVMPDNAHDNYSFGPIKVIGADTGLKIEMGN